ncbi:hypothetical protein [Enhygromyxa salina]|uniref:hypothetical protein n=1 Tax=Enhygromyxa salina TaxID=215803 RepID=UPI0006985924|nr:hypothetical protein [Enhygromyxa salina]
MPLCNCTLGSGRPPCVTELLVEGSEALLDVWQRQVGVNDNFARSVLGNDDEAVIKVTHEGNALGTIQCSEGCDHVAALVKGNDLGAFAVDLDLDMVDHKGIGWRQAYLDGLAYK